MSVNERQAVSDNVFLVCKDALTGDVKWTTSVHNIVTDAGDRNIAKRLLDGTFTVTLTHISVLTAFVTTPPTKSANFSWISPAKSGTKTLDAGWPQINGGDSGANPGTTATDIVTYKVSYGTQQANATIVGVAVHNANPVVSTALLNAASLTTHKEKTSSDLLSAYVNIRLNGV